MSQLCLIYGIAPIYLKNGRLNMKTKKNMVSLQKFDWLPDSNAVKFQSDEFIKTVSRGFNTSRVFGVRWLTA